MTEEIKDENQPVAEEKQSLFKKKNKKVEALQEEIEKLSLENAELKNQYFKAYADADNFQKRAQKDLENAMKYRIQSFAQKMLPVIDNLERALASAKEDDPMRIGVQMIYDQLMNALKDEGVTEVEALNQPFDGNYHQSLISQVVEGVEPGIVVEVLQKGYLLKDRILRAALVKVSE